MTLCQRTKPALSTRYFLTLEESQDGFALAPFGKKQMTRFITPLIECPGLLCGALCSVSGVGRYYVALGIFFLSFTNSHALLVSADDV